MASDPSPLAHPQDGESFPSVIRTRPGELLVKASMIEQWKKAAMTPHEMEEQVKKEQQQWIAQGANKALGNINSDKVFVAKQKVHYGLNLGLRGVERVE